MNLEMNLSPGVSREAAQAAVVACVSTASLPIAMDVLDSDEKDSTLEYNVVQLDWLLAHPDDFRVLCKISLEELKAFVAACGEQWSTDVLGHWKYSVAHRAVIFALQMRCQDSLVRSRFERQWAIGSIWLDSERWWQGLVDNMANDREVGLGWLSDSEEQHYEQNCADRFEHRCIYIMDGLKMLIRSPAGKKQQDYYSKYVAGHCVYYLLYIDRIHGRIRYVSTGFKPRGTSEKTINEQIHVPLRGGKWKIMADGGFRGDERCVIPYRRDQIRHAKFPLGALWLAWNREFRRARVLIEWIIGRLRFMWSIFEGYWRGNMAGIESGRMDLAMRAACVMHNFLCHKRGVWPLQDAAFDPEDIAVGADDHVDARPFDDIDE